MLGAAEAKMMQSEKLFANPGDTLRDFFGADVFIAGIMLPMNSSVDMMHIVPPGVVSR